MSLLIQQAPGQRYLQTSDGVPWQMRGDSPWEMMVKLQEADVVQYFANRQEKGFNTSLVELIVVNTAYSPNAPANAYGDLPFTGVPFQSSLNTPYWDFVRFCFETAADYENVIQAVPNYIGYGGGSEGWWSAMLAAGAANVEAYAAAVATLLGDLDNIIWVNGGDWFPTSNFQLITAQAAGILSVDTRHLYTTHWNRNTTGTDGGPYSWLTLNSSYPDQATVSSLLLSGYQDDAPLTTYMIEGRYYGSFDGQPALNAKDTRVEAWQACLQGGRSDNYGDHTIWPFFTGWQAAMDNAGSVSMAAMHSFMKMVQWWKLAPDASNAMVQAGSRGTLGTVNYVAAALASDGSFGVSNIPAGGSVTYNMSVYPREVEAFWMDPSVWTAPNNISLTPVAGGPFPNTGTKVFTTPGNNADGQTDWVLYTRAVGSGEAPVAAFGFWTS